MTQKMIVIPYEKYKNLKSKLETYEQYSPNNERNDRDLIPEVVEPLKEELNTLPDAKQLLHTNTSISSITEQNEDDRNQLSEDDIIEYFPKTFHRRCRLLLRHMKGNSMAWDSQGRLILNKEECITNSHIVDLISYAICNYIKQRNSDSGKHFTKLLIGTHCPLSILNIKDS